MVDGVVEIGTDRAEGYRGRLGDAGRGLGGGFGLRRRRAALSGRALGVVRR
jgi:hypothetical protein